MGVERGRRRVWSETASYDVLVSEHTLSLLRRFGLELIVAVRPWDVVRVPEVVRACRRADVPLTLWPMLADEDGRWAGVENAEPFARFVEDLERTVERGVSFALDLEPPIHRVRALTTGGTAALGLLRPRSEFDRGAARLTKLANGLRARGREVVVAALPLVLHDRAGAFGGWQRLLGTPLDRLEVDHTHVMLYTTMLEGWSRGLFDRDDARALLAAACKRVPLSFGSRGGVALGAVGVGALGDEPIYRSPAELADDVAIARAAGVEDLSLFDLGGVFARPPAEAWLEAFTETAATTNSFSTPRARMVGALARATAFLARRAHSLR